MTGWAWDAVGVGVLLGVLALAAGTGRRLRTEREWLEQRQEAERRLRRFQEREAAAALRPHVDRLEVAPINRPRPQLVRERRGPRSTDQVKVEDGKFRG